MEGRKSILVIEDIAPVRDLLCSILSSDGFKVLGCSNGVDALAAADAGDYDIIITDYRLPSMSGLDLTRLLRMRFPLSRIIGVSSENVEKAFYAAGADAFLLKPYLYADIIKALEDT